MEGTMANFIQLKFKFYDFWRTYILKEHDCDNCKYFGGLMCDHIDENGKCLGWERDKFNLKKWWRYYKTKRIINSYIKEQLNESKLSKRKF